MPLKAAALYTVSRPRLSSLHVINVRVDVCKLMIAFCWITYESWRRDDIDDD